MKKGISILLVVFLCLGLFAGCGGGTTAPSGGGMTTTPSTPAAGGDKPVYEVTAAHASAETVSMQRGFEYIKETLEASGRFKVNLYANAQLGGDREAIEGLQNGNIHMYCGSSAPYVNFVAKAAIFDMPFVYTDIAQARKTVNEPTFFGLISKEFEAAGMHLNGFTDQGFRTLTLNKVVKTPEDMKGVSIRTMENQYHMEVWRAIGANPTPLAYNELYTALQQNTVDGQENPIELIHSQKFYEQQKYVILTNHILQQITWTTNLDWYNSLDEEARTLFDKTFEESRKVTLDAQDSSVARYKQEIEAAGTEFIELTPEELSLFSDKAATTWDMIKTDVGDEIYTAFMTARDN